MKWIVKAGSTWLNAAPVSDEEPMSHATTNRLEICPQDTGGDIQSKAQHERDVASRVRTLRSFLPERALRRKIGNRLTVRLDLRLSLKD